MKSRKKNTHKINSSYERARQVDCLLYLCMHDPMFAFEFIVLIMRSLFSLYNLFYSHTAFTSHSTSHSCFLFINKLILRSKILVLLILTKFNAKKQHTHKFHHVYHCLQNNSRIYVMEQSVNWNTVYSKYRPQCLQ